MINKYVDEESGWTRGVKVAKKSRKCTKTIDGVKVGEPTIVSGIVIEVLNLRKNGRGSGPLDGTTMKRIYCRASV